MKPFIVYIKPDTAGYITAVNSSAFLIDRTGWVEIDSGYGDRYHHAQGNYFPLPIRTETGACRYKLANGQAVPCSPEEIAAQEEALCPKPTASRNRMEGEYLTLGGTLFRVIHPIPRGEPILPGQNVMETSLEELLTLLTKGE